jgi:hypothetical protein
MKITLNGTDLSLSEAIQIALKDKRGISCLLHHRDGDKFFVRLSDGTSIEVEHTFLDGLFGSFFASLQAREPIIFSPRAAKSEEPKPQHI